MSPDSTSDLLGDNTLSNDPSIHAALEPKALAEQLGIFKRVVYRLIEEGIIDPVLTEKQVQAWMENPPAWLQTERRRKMDQEKTDHTSSKPQTPADKRAARAQAKEHRRAKRQSVASNKKELHKLRRDYGFPTTTGNPSEISVAEAAAFFHLSHAQIRGAIEKQHIPVSLRPYRARQGRSERYVMDLETLIHLDQTKPGWLQSAQHRAQSVRARKPRTDSRQTHDTPKHPEYSARELTQAEAMVRVSIPRRMRDPESVQVHSGPTNSGKTYQALQHLIQEGKGVYAAPLRFLAREAFERLGNQLGEEQVGLVTGEERINDQAPIICCTVEMAPLEGHLLALDECHWAADPNRGAAWTRLLCAGDYRFIHLMTSPDALPLLERAFPEATVHEYERKSPLVYGGKRALGRLEPGTAVVCFSRKAVLAMAAKIAQQGISVAALYGALPPETRRAELKRFSEGQAQVLCTTDVIGHGVNIPHLKTIVFAESEKFDGTDRRALEPWEVAQIAGRAGRFGYAERGTVLTLKGDAWYNADDHIIQQGLKPTREIREGTVGFRYITHGRIRPRLSDLGCSHAGEIGIALQAWVKKARSDLRSDWIRVDKCETAIYWHRELVRIGAHHHVSLEEAWRMINAPLDPDMHPAIFQAMIDCTLHPHGHPVLDQYLSIKTIPALDLEAAESRAKHISAIRWFINSFQPDAYTPEQAARVEHLVSDHITKLLMQAIDQQEFGRCARCGRECAPWFQYCDPCFHRGTPRSSRRIMAR